MHSTDDHMKLSPFTNTIQRQAEQNKNGTDHLEHSDICAFASFGLIVHALTPLFETLTVFTLLCKSFESPLTSLYLTSKKPDFLFYILK